MGGEGFYDVEECKFELTKEYIEEDGDDPNYERFLELVGTMTFKVPPRPPQSVKCNIIAQVRNASSVHFA